MNLADEALLVFQGQGRAPYAGSWPGQPETGSKLPRLDSALRQSVEITFGDACRNLIVFGLTGMGKSTGIMKPALERLLDSGCSGLVLDCKEDYAAFARAYPERVVLLGASTLCRPINLLADMPSALFQSLLEQLRPKSQKDPYWGSMAVQDAMLVFDYYRLRYDRSATLDEIYQALFQPRRFVARFDRWLGSRQSLPQPFALRLDAVRQNAFSILAAGGSGMARLSADHPDVQRQYAWHTNQLMAALSPFAANPAIRRFLCAADSDCDFTGLLYDERRIAILDMPMRIFGHTSHLVAGVLRQRMMQAVLSHPDPRQAGYGIDRFTFLLADEFQRHLSLRSEAVAAGSLDDAAWFESSREYGHINIVATQGVASLHHRANGDSASVNALLQNFGSMIALPTHDPYTQRQFGGWTRGMVAEELLDDVSMEGGIGRGVLLSHHLSRHQGPLIARIHTGHIAGHPHMGRHFGSAPPHLPADRFQVEEAPPIGNPFAGHRPLQPGRGIRHWSADDVADACAELREWFAHSHRLLSADYLHAVQELAQRDAAGREERQRCDYRFGGHRVDLVVAAPSAADAAPRVSIEILHADASPDLGSIQHRLRLSLPLAQQLLEALDTLCERLAKSDSEPTPMMHALGEGWSITAFGRGRHAHLHLQRSADETAELDIGLGLTAGQWLQTAIRGWLEVALHPAPPDADAPTETAPPTKPSRWLQPLVADLESLWQDEPTENDR